jgi:MFS transporter, ACS family, tartrate transporter
MIGTGGIALVNVNSRLGGFAGPYIVGALRQQSGSYGSDMITLAVGLALPAVVVLALGCLMAPRATMTRLRAGSGA